jgi:ATP-dependent helicase/nuclease subunit B
MPQITTIRDWATSLGVVAKRPTDLHFDEGIDRLIAQARLAPLRLGAEPAYVQRLLAMTRELAPVLAAIRPSERAAWVDPQLRLFSQGGQFQLEGAIGLLALAWASETRYDTDVLWERQAALLASTEHFYISQGLQADLLVQALLDGASSKTTPINLGALESASGNAPIHEYTAADFEDLVQQTAAVILTSPAQSIALIAVDRQITRRVSAVLANRGVALIDETGWALSTTTVAAQWMAWLDAMAFDATSDAVLAALKAAPLRFLPADVSVLEQKIRSQSQVAWLQTGSDLLGDWPARFAKPRPITSWLMDTQALMQHVGLWESAATDLAGQAMLKALHLRVDGEGAAPSALASFAAPMPRTAYVAWVRAVLEANRFRLKFDARKGSFGQAGETDDAGRAATVTILPLAQTWGRHFDAVVVPSCDDRHLPARPHQQSDWSAAQREALTLPTADDAALAQSKAWAWLCGLPSLSLLWQQMEGTEELQKSSLLQVLEMEGRLESVSFLPPLSFPRRRESMDGLTRWHDDLDVFKDGVSIDWPLLAPAQLSASAYADLRACPYRFYATRILGLRDSDELDEAVDKRDFGNWLHGTLYRFHEALKQEPSLEREALLDRCAAAEQKSLGLDDAAFLPFSLIWPKTRDAYLAWLAGHEAKGIHYLAGEVEKSYPLEVAGKTVKLFGKLDRIDRADAASGGAHWLLDYKTEALTKTKARINKDADEDTQLAFYAALAFNDAALSDAPIHAAYVNLVEGAKATDETTTNELLDLEARRDTLLDGIWTDLTRMAEGHGLRALGEGDACTHCKVRGLCRKDFKQDAA